MAFSEVCWGGARGARGTYGGAVTRDGGGDWFNVVGRLATPVFSLSIRAVALVTDPGDVRAALRLLTG